MSPFPSPRAFVDAMDSSNSIRDEIEVEAPSIPLILEPTPPQPPNFKFITGMPAISAQDL